MRQRGKNQNIPYYCFFFRLSLVKKTNQDFSVRLLEGERDGELCLFLRFFQGGRCILSEAGGSWNMRGRQLFYVSGSWVRHNPADRLRPGRAGKDLARSVFSLTRFADATSKTAHTNDVKGYRPCVKLPFLVGLPIKNWLRRFVSAYGLLCPQQPFAISAMIAFMFNSMPTAAKATYLSSNLLLLPFKKILCSCFLCLMLLAEHRLLAQPR
jgi:hypothetical protein